MRVWLARHRRVVAELVHVGLAALALAAAFLLRFEFQLDPDYRRMLALALPVVIVVKAGIFRAFALRDVAWRYIGFAELQRLAAANVIASLACALCLRAVIGNTFPRSIYILDLLLCLALLVAARAVVRHMFERGTCRHARNARRILIYGAGQAGRMLLSEIRANPQLGYQVAGFLDDDPGKRDLWLSGVRVLGAREDLTAVARRERIEEVLLAMPTAGGAAISALLECCRAVPVVTRIIPPLAELVTNRVLAEQVREVRVEDLLGRAPVRLEDGAIRHNLRGKVVLVTGAAGSIGAELCRQIARFAPRVLVGFDQAETGLYQLEHELRAGYADVLFHAEVGSIQNWRRVDDAFRHYRPDMVFHAAAYKHVPVMETHLFEAIENNVFGTDHVAQAAAAWRAGTFLLVSSDKAVRPANIMGASKRLAEMVCLAAGAEHPRTRFLAVRFGNVLGSSGSVIPLFQKQIAAGGPLTITHPDMQRFFMTVTEAAQLMLQAASTPAVNGGAGAPADGGEVFVLDMGAPVRIVDLAHKMVLLSGLRPDQDIRIEFTGVRPGEKLYEELSAYEENTVATPHEQVRAYTGRGISRAEMESCLAELRRSIDARDAASLLLCLKDMIPDYNPSRIALERALAQPPRGMRGDLSRLAAAAAG